MYESGEVRWELCRAVFVRTSTHETLAEADAHARKRAISHPGVRTWVGGPDGVTVTYEHPADPSAWEAEWNRWRLDP